MSQLVCGFCSTGCSLRFDGKVLTPSPDYPVNLGAACPKGWESLAPLEARDRATTPLLRGRPVDWSTALRSFVERAQAITRRHGPESFAFLSTGQIVTEEMALLGALAKFGMGMLHGDGNTRQCMATSVVAYKESFGFDAPPYTYADFEASDVIVLVGSNLCIAHPILWQRVLRNPHHPAIVVIDPRKTETAMAATMHLAPRPKSDLSLFYGLARDLIERGCIDRAFIDAHTSGFEAFREHARAFDRKRVCADSGLEERELDALADTIARGKRVSFWWTMGVNQSHQGTRTAQAIINLALLTGNIGRPGTGANSITGQCNAMGSRLFSNTASLLGGRNFGNPEHRRQVADILGIDAGRIPTTAGWAYDQIIEGILGGHIKALWVIATNPAHSWINQVDLRQILERLDLLVVQDLYTTTETAQMADVLLPAAGWGEKDGTFINSERRIGVVRKIARAPGQALADFHIFRAVAEAWGCADLFARWRSPAAAFELVKQLSRGMPCDFSGIDEAMLERGVQWPYTSAQVERRLFEDGRFYHPDGRARFVFETPRPLPEPANRRYPFTLLTGRGSASQWHTQTRTRKSAVLERLHPREIYVEINPLDARRLGIADSEWVEIASQRAIITARAFLTHTVRAGQVFIPMHYGATNRLTFAAFDPYSRQPAYKACAVDVRRCNLRA